MTFQTLTWIVGLLFLVLKLFGVITFSWWFVITPFFVIPIIYLLFFFIAGAAVAIARS